MANTYNYFLGSNSVQGFYSLYDHYTNDGETLYILKGGAGCGKSTFMKTVGARAEMLGIETEYIWCSGDPDSVDGVRFPTLKIAFADGTAPHVLEPKLTGVTANYINLGEMYDTAKLKPKRMQLMQLMTSYKSRYSKAYGLLSAYGTIKRSIYDTVHTAERTAMVIKRAEGIAKREIRKKKGSGIISNRLLSAFTYKGIVTFDSDIAAKYEKIYLLDNEYGNAHLILEVLAKRTAEAGWNITVSPDPLLPDKIAAIIVPELSLVFMAGKHPDIPRERIYRHLRLDAPVDCDFIRSEKAHIKSMQKLCSAVLKEVQQYLIEAKSLHDMLEEEYNPCVDFDGVYELAAKYGDMFFN